MPSADRLSLLAFCPWNGFAGKVRRACPNATILPTWSAFEDRYSASNICMAVVPEVVPEFALRAMQLRRLYPLPLLVVATRLSRDHLLVFRRTVVDEFIDLERLGAPMESDLVFPFVSTLRERLTSHLERAKGVDGALRWFLFTALRDPCSFGSVRSLSRKIGVTVRTLENHWHAFNRGPWRLKDALWAIRLLHALELRSSGASVSGIAEALGVDARTLRHASHRQLGMSLGMISAERIGVEAARLSHAIAGLPEPLANSEKVFAFRL